MQTENTLVDNLSDQEESEAAPPKPAIQERPNAKRKIGEGREHTLSESTKITLKKLEYDYEIARLGLQGTLWGAWASLVAILLIVYAPALTQRDIVQGWQLVVVVGLFVISVVLYGAFIFDRALSVSTEVRKEGIASLQVNSADSGKKDSSHE